MLEHQIRTFGINIGTPLRVSFMYIYLFNFQFTAPCRNGTRATLVLGPNNAGHGQGPKTSR